MTEAGKRLLALILALDPDRPGSRSLWQDDIAAIEAEATAAAEQRLGDVRAAIEEEAARACDCFTDECKACRGFNALLALLDAAPPASPRQGEPVAGLSSAFLEAVTTLVDAVLDRPLADPDDDAMKAARAVLRTDPTLSTDPAEPVAPDKEGNG